ncbi:MAG: hypothetical protein LBU87_00775 [Lactobacillales bacterium]|jgi:hypothetical protein|nr:hypothetical protein [Lactobacillales bacterium]
MTIQNNIKATFSAMALAGATYAAEQKVEFPDGNGGTITVGSFEYDTYNDYAESKNYPAGKEGSDEVIRNGRVFYKDGNAIASFYEGVMQQNPGKAKIDHRRVGKSTGYVFYPKDHKISIKKNEKTPSTDIFKKNNIGAVSLKERAKWSEFNFEREGTSIKAQTAADFMNLFLNVDRKERVGYREVPVKIDLKINPVKTDIKKLITFSDEFNKSIESIEKSVQGLKLQKDFWTEFGAEHVRFAIKDRLNMLTPPVQVASHTPPKNPTADLQKKKQ